MAQLVVTLNQFRVGRVSTIMSFSKSNYCYGLTIVFSIIMNCFRRQLLKYFHILNKNWHAQWNRGGNHQLNLEILEFFVQSLKFLELLRWNMCFPSMKIVPFVYKFLNSNTTFESISRINEYIIMPHTKQIG